MTGIEGSQTLRVGILALCPPPYGGIARMMENHLNYWPPDRVKAYHLPNYCPPNPQPFARAAYVDLIHNASRSWKGILSYITCLAHSPLTRPRGYVQFVRYNTALSWLIRRENLNVLYAHEVWPAGASAVLQSRIHGIATVVVAYGETWHTIPEHRRWRRVEPMVLKGASWVVSTSEHCLKGALNQGADPKRASVIYAGIDLGRFHPDCDGSAFREKYRIPADAVVISALGLALRRKLDTMLDALERMDFAGNLHCLIGGIGDDSAYVQERAKAIRGVKVQVLGFVPDAELPQFYAATDVLVVSPKTLLECMGQSMKEAMACGRAVVGARIGGVPEAIRDGCSGLLFDPDDPGGLVQALRLLCENPALRQEMGRKGRLIAEEKFGADVSARQTLEVFKRLSSSRS